MPTTDEPLIYTTDGNVPLASLAYQTNWHVGDDIVKFSERYLDANGRVVKECVHVYDRNGVFGTGAANF